MSIGSLVIVGGTLVVVAEIATWCFKAAAKGERQYRRDFVRNERTERHEVARRERTERHEVAEESELNAAILSVKQGSDFTRRPSSNAKNGMRC